MSTFDLNRSLVLKSKYYKIKINEEEKIYQPLTPIHQQINLKTIDIAILQKKSIKYIRYSISDIICFILTENQNLECRKPNWITAFSSEYFIQSQIHSFSCKPSLQPTKINYSFSSITTIIIPLKITSVSQNLIFISLIRLKNFSTLFFD